MDEFSGVLQVVFSLVGLMLSIAIPVLIVITYLRTKRIENWLKHQTRLLDQLAKRLDSSS